MYQSILDAISREIDNLAIVYNHPDTGTIRALAFQVNAINRRIEHVTNLPTISNGGTLDTGYIGENGHQQTVSDPGDEIFRVSANYEDTIEELGIRVNPDGVLTWLELPSGALVTGVQGDRLRGLGPGDPRSGVLSDWTKTTEGIPTTAISPTPDQGVVKIDSQENGRNLLYFGFENKSGDEQTPTIYALGATYKVVNVQDEQVIKDMTLGKGYKRRVLTWGGFGNTDPALPTAWSKTTIQPSEANQFLSEIGGS